MKKQSLRCVCAALLVLGLYAAASHVAAQNEPIAGGYSGMSAKGAKAKSIAAFAARTQSAVTNERLTLLEITKAEQQVVAGMNYRVCMRVRDPRRHTQTVTAVVFQPLGRHSKLELTNWKPGGCTEL